MPKAKKEVESKSRSLIDRYLATTKSEAYLLNQNKFPIRDWINSSNYALNALISADWKKGYPSGRFVQLAGPASVGKSFLCIQAMIEAQKMGYVVYLIDSEFGGEPDSWIKRGLNPNMFIHNPVHHIKTITGELLLFLSTLNEDDKAMVVIDSIGNLSSSKETIDISEFNEKRDMTRAQEIKAMFRQLVVPAGKKNVPFLLVNHEYSTTDLYAKKVQSGGTGPAYGSSIVISMTKSKDKDDTDNTGTFLTCTNIKNRFAKETSQVKLSIKFDKGLNPYSGLLDIASDLGYITSPSQGYFAVKGFEDVKFRKKQLEYEEEMWIKLLNTDFGNDLNKYFSYQSHAADILEDEKLVTKSTKKSKEKIPDEK